MGSVRAVDAPYVLFEDPSVGEPLLIFAHIILVNCFDTPRSFNLLKEPIHKLNFGLGCLGEK